MGKEPPLVQRGEFEEWIIEETEDWLVVNKPGWLICHPSKNGPWSSLVGVAREYLGGGSLHLVSRLDRETSGVVVIAKHADAARDLQQAVEQRRVRKTYHAILRGDFRGTVYVSGALASDTESPIIIKDCVWSGKDAKRAETIFEAVYAKNGFTLCKVQPVSGRKHQIRAHAEWIGYPILGDKIYGTDPKYFLSFIEEGLTKESSHALQFPRQALHASRLEFLFPDKEPLIFEAVITEDMNAFLREKMAFDGKNELL